MIELLAAIASALWLGILTSISPCPMATNVAAISFVGKRLTDPKQVLWAGLLYTLGRTLAYTVLGVLLVSSLLHTPVVSLALQKYMNKLIGPLLVIIGVFLLELIPFAGKGGGMAGVIQRWQARVQGKGVWGAFVLGALFALTFCPISATLFFGSLLSLAVTAQSSVLVPAVYGIATALPVLLFAVLIAVGARSLGSAFARISRFEGWARTLTGVLFIGLGIYFSLLTVYRVWD